MFSTVLFEMFCFGLAHIHHIYNSPPIAVLFQLFYTSVFGAYSTFLFLRTGTSCMTCSRSSSVCKGHLLAPVLSHIFCNYMGFPAVDTEHPRLKLIALAFVGGLVSFFMLMMPLTEPTWHQSIYFLNPELHHNQSQEEISSSIYLIVTTVIGAAALIAGAFNMMDGFDRKRVASVPI